ncbi:hypothetical protein ANSO36C_56160 [Nostoc cf. commune SO-36]|uniref:Uncharacterized protein n=1 Tax=Nostoc cf. commune SO-36 TaxID=449208 RepID=A0ABN6QBM6_NOSCO|nr:hypothetical protein ANSO36C_56160 [Nostoc cf. commune SO-36]
MLASPSGTWGEPTPESTDTNAVYTGVGNNTFTWGDPNVCLPSANISNGCQVTGSNKLEL